MGGLVKSLIEDGFESIRDVDQKPVDEWHQVVEEAENLSMDLRGRQEC